MLDAAQLAGRRLQHTTAIACLRAASMRQHRRQLPSTAMEAASLSLNLTTNARGAIVPFPRDRVARRLGAVRGRWGCLRQPARRRGYVMLPITQITAPSPRAALWQERAARRSGAAAAAPAADSIDDARAPSSGAAAAAEEVKRSRTRTVF